MLPNFIVIGAAKSGTSTLCHMLGQHPDVFMCNPKEPHYFSHHPRSHRSLQWYESLFEGATSSIAVGEGSTSYTAPSRVRRAATNLAKVIPECKFIYIARDPVRRLESDWKMRLHEGWTSKSISDAVIRQPDLINASLYWESISVYRECFSDNQIKVIILEEFSLQPDRVLEECFDFVGVSKEFSQQFSTIESMNNAANFREYNPLLGNFAYSKLWYDVRDYVPRPLRTAALKLFSKKRVYSTQWDAVLLNGIIAELREDAGKFLNFYNKSGDLWSLQSQFEVVES